MRSSTSNTNSTSNSTNKRKLQQILPIPSNSLNSNTDTNNIQDLKSTPLKPKKKYNKKRKLLSNKSNYIPSVTTKIINKNPPEFQDQPKPRHLKSCSRCLTCELEIVIPIKRSNIIKNLSDNIDDLKLKVDELLANHIVLQKKCIEKGLKVDGLLDINTINYFNTEESQENNNNLLDFNMEYEDEDEDEEVFPVADAADAHADSERETSVEEEEEEEEEHAEETENDINETKLPTSTSMLHSNSRSNSTNKLFSPVSTATSLSSDEDEAEVDKLSINEEFEKDECGFIKSDYSIDEINYIENKNHNNDQLNEFNLIINNSIVKSISLHDSEY
ncbi:unnamed protein product [[Candida] boidinii]|nr:unnamed protein product [[Candida] boidinii]